jgi:hypothetical protein
MTGVAPHLPRRLTLPACLPAASPSSSRASAGVGKSELAKTLANYYFGSEEAMVRGAGRQGRRVPAGAAFVAADLRAGLPAALRAAECVRGTGRRCSDTRALARVPAHRCAWT